MSSKEETGDNMIGNLPLWVKAAVKLGFPSLISFILLAALLGLIESPMTKMLVVLDRQSQILSKLDANDQAQWKMLLSSIEYQNMLSRTICRTIVPTQTQYQCEPRWRGYDEERGKQ